MARPGIVQITIGSAEDGPAFPPILGRNGPPSFSASRLMSAPPRSLGLGQVADSRRCTHSCSKEAFVTENSKAENCSAKHSSERSCSTCTHCTQQRDGGAGDGWTCATRAHRMPACQHAILKTSARTPRSLRASNVFQHAERMAEAGRFGGCSEQFCRVEIAWQARFSVFLTPLRASSRLPSLLQNH